MGVTDNITIVVIEVAEGEDAALQKILSSWAGRLKYDVLEFASLEALYAQSPQCMSFPDLTIRVNEQAVYRNGKPIHLGHYEFFTLCYLARRPGWVFSREQIYEAVWREPGEIRRAIVTNTISQIRHKIWPENPMGGYIQTVHNSGYKFEIS
jgi:DNA-binding response OmpR family regulator